MNNVKIIFFLLASVLLCACSRQGDDAKKGDVTPAVRCVEAEAFGAGGNQQYPGKVVSADDANVSFKVAGTLRRVNVEEGQHVRKGQILAEMDNTDYSVQLKATEAEYAQIKAEAERVIALYQDGGTTASNYDKARYGLQQIEAKLQNHRNQLSYTRIYAPYDGYVQKVYMNAGETVGAGMPVIGILSSGTPEVEINLPVTAYAQRDKFVSYTCTFDVLPGEALEAVPASVLAQANSNQLYKMRLKLVEKNDAVSPGMSTWVTISSTQGDESKVRIPSTCILRESGTTCVFIFNAQSETVKKVGVTVDELHTDGTAVVSGNVSAGDVLVATGVHHVKDGQKVRAMEPASATNVGGLM